MESLIDISKLSKKNLDRYHRIVPNNEPKYVRCYDNGGDTIDRYTVVLTGKYTHKTSGEHWYIGMSGNPMHPMGVCEHGSSRTQIDRPKYSHLGKKIKFNELSENAKLCVMKTYLYLWDFIDINDNQI